MTGADFQPYSNPYKRRCSECGEWIQEGQNVLASIKNNKVRKVVCSEDCRLEFDYKFWSERADEREERTAWN
jgi:hypothetical protein